ncbi:RICIN domain-containing protein [Planomonospora sp. ID67723]|uniref:RICIN domain-containing protein n=1 Tax=Planomonospora sp. ID67723 TaxID=2738134 RepID=UPI0018C39DE2|nr:RICIN domain-containing protein [Planomonospora sp. ID67723]MBG0830665.1 RICIN domain-containing protein [Planomonospora sp. ID67723]
MIPTSKPCRRAGVPRPGTGDRGSLPMALLLTLVGISLSALLVPVVIGQITVTRTGSERVHALHAAQAGIDAALGQIRAAADGAGNGVVEKLPSCELSGNLLPDSSLDSPRYRVEITYRNADGTVLACPPPDVPATASIVATGTETPEGAFGTGTKGTRTLEATYSFQTTNANIAGGAIPVAQPTIAPLCMDAGPVDPPAPGTPLRMQPCKPGVSEQQFAYTEDLSLKLVGSESSSAPMGMCLDAGSPHRTGASVLFQPCLDRTPRQQWSLNNNSNFQGTSNGVALNSFCLSLRNPGLPGSYVVLGGCTTTATQTVFRPQPGVGAGMASAATGQLVNFKQFSRCLDVTDHVVSRPYMIVWFCKQAPDGNVSWNQKWSIPAVVAPARKTTGRIRTVYNNQGYCLRSPNSTAANQYVTVTACAATGTLATNLQWTVYGDTGDYTTSYRIMDGYGNCLVPTDLEALSPDTHSDGTSKTKVAVCDDSELQKWNAPANLKQPLPLTDINER